MKNELNFVYSPKIRRRFLTAFLSSKSEFINSNWTWTNGSERLRLYVKDEKMITLFKLKWVEDK